MCDNGDVASGEGDRSRFSELPGQEVADVVAERGELSSVELNTDGTDREHLRIGPFAEVAAMRDLSQNQRRSRPAKVLLLLFGAAFLTPVLVYLLLAIRHFVF